MKYSNTLTLRGEHDKGQNKGKQMRKTQTDCSVSFKLLYTAYRTTTRYAMDLQHKMFCPAQLTWKSNPVLCLKPNCMF